MDLKLVILGMVFVVVLIMMGDNPFAVPEEYKRDPFRYRLEKKLAEQEKTTGTLDFEDPTKNSLFGATAPSGFMKQPSYTQQTGQNGVSPPGSGEATMNENTMLVPGPGGTGYVVQQKAGTYGNWQQFQQAVENTQTQQKQGTAPTPPGAAGTTAPPPFQPGQVVPLNNSLATPVPQSTLGSPVPPGATAPQRQPDGAPAFFLKDGRRVFFSGYKVYVLIPDGQIQLLPDGDHQLSSGETIVMRGGKRRAVR